MVPDAGAADRPHPAHAAAVTPCPEATAAVDALREVIWLEEHHILRLDGVSLELVGAELTWVVSPLKSQVAPRLLVRRAGKRRLLRHRAEATVPGRGGDRAFCPPAWR